MLSFHHERPSGVASFFQITEHPVSSESSKARDILNEHPIGSTLMHEPEHFEPQPGSLALEAFAFAGDADVLTGESSANEVDLTQSTWVKGADILEDRDTRPVAPQDRSTVGLDFAEGDGSHSGSLKSEGEASDS